MLVGCGMLALEKLHDWRMGKVVHLQCVINKMRRGQQVGESGPILGNEAWVSGRKLGANAMGIPTVVGYVTQDIANDEPHE